MSAPTLVRIAELTWPEPTAELGDRNFEAIVAAMVSYFSSGAATVAGTGRTA